MDMGSVAVVGAVWLGAILMPPTANKIQNEVELSSAGKRGERRCHDRRARAQYTSSAYWAKSSANLPFPPADMALQFRLSNW
jgi:hypothetical protein